MIHELRIYTIAQGKMEEWIDVFQQKVAPIYRNNGVSIPASWRDDQRNEFVWIRACKDAEELKKLHKVVVSLPEFQALESVFEYLEVKILETRLLNPLN